MITIAVKWTGFVSSLCLILALATACTTFEKPTDSFGAIQRLEESAPAYRLGANDALRLEVFGEPDLTTETVVNSQGVVRFPLLGELQIGGKTVQEAEQYLTELLKAGYLKNPRVSVYIVLYRNVYLNGEVNRPGAYPYEEGLTVHKAVTLAGGFTVNAAKGSVKVLRTGMGKEKIVTLEMDDAVHPDDLIIISESFF